MLDLVLIAVYAVAANALACGPLAVAEIKESSPDVVRIENRSAEGWSISTLSFAMTRSGVRFPSAPQMFSMN